ncbi:hypothetical protein DNH61_07780 [Paenibacillus sambharensis]|uniref:Dit-like phage tail protein N-terminal domain-containing protein n=1 Tax=Paenibacillus sambharensis TaxID=1803190 RepID=A0A2W1LXH6_9BACL|nr:hypothetical protein [Paenibacillus sambharensis]PZD96401.1 hypothetical protein DNH61_07780 [Paenibacillus sambharensis]
MATIDGHYVLVESEEPSYENQATEQPVEKGVNLTDHVQRLARKLSIKGIVAGPGASRKRAYLIQASDSGKVVYYSGRNTFRGVITGLTTGHTSSIADGFTFSMTLREIRVASSSTVSQLPLAIRSQVSPVTSSGTKQTKSKRDESTEMHLKKSSGGNSLRKPSEKVKPARDRRWT